MGTVAKGTGKIQEQRPRFDQTKLIYTELEIWMRSQRRFRLGSEANNTTLLYNCSEQTEFSNFCVKHSPCSPPFDERKLLIVLHSS